MNAASQADLDVNSAIAAVEKVADGFAAGLHARLSALVDLSDELATLLNVMATASTSPFILSLEIALVAVITASTFLFL